MKLSSSYSQQNCIYNNFSIHNSCYSWTLCRIFLFQKVYIFYMQAFVATVQ